MNLKELSEKLEIEEDEFLDLVCLFVETGSSDLNELQSAIGDKDAQKAARAAHSIKGAAVILGLGEIFELAKEMEMNARANDLEGATGAVKSMKEELDRIAKDLNKKVKCRS
jgi:HPt (histidine-containing phosphotransfer) domain-containing protein